MSKCGKDELIFDSMPVPKAILKLAVPTVISQIITIIYNMADTFFIGQLGDPKQVASATLAMPLFMFMTALSNLFGVGGASLISRLLGIGNREKASRTCGFCIWTGVIAAGCYGILTVIFLPILLSLLGANGDTWDLTSSYIFWTVGIGAIPTVLNPELAHLIRSEGHSRQASLGVAMGGLVNIVLDPIFIFGFKMQIKGAAIATLISNIVAMLYFVIFIIKHKNTSVITLSIKQYSLKDKIPSEVITIGLPSFLISLMGTISNTVLNHIISGYSNEAIAGMGIAKKVNLLAFAVAQGITQGTLPLIGYNYTSGNRKRLIEIIIDLFVFALIIALVIAVVLYTNATRITRLFINDQETIMHGQNFLHIISCACPMSTLTFFALTVFQATGKKVQPLILSLLRKGTIDVPFMFLFNFKFGITGTAWATPLAESISVAVSLMLVIPYICKISKNPTMLHKN